MNYQKLYDQEPKVCVRNSFEYQYPILVPQVSQLITRNCSLTTCMSNLLDKVFDVIANTEVNIRDSLLC